MAKLRRRWAVFSWAALLSYAAIIDLTLTAVPAWREALFKRYGEGIFDTITYGAAAALMSLILAAMIWRNREKKILPYLSLIAVLLFLRYVMRHWITITAEQIHFIEYGIMGFLAYNALRYHLKGWGLVAAALLLTYFFGMVDECIQGNLASRVGEQRDMLWNGLAGLMGLAVVVLSLKPKWIRGASGPNELGAGLLMVALCAPLQGYFNTAIAQFGVLIKDEARGVNFRSRLKPENLLLYNDNIEAFKREIAPRAEKIRMAELLPEVHDSIHEEALVHAFRRFVYYRSGNYPVAYKETLILAGYYPQFVEGTDLQWPASRIAQMQSDIGDLAFSTYESPVAEHLITKFSAMQMWVVLAFLEAGIAILFFRRFRGKRNFTFDV